MIVVWDEIKRTANLAKHRMDFADLDPEFFDRAVIRLSSKGCSLAIGIFKGAVIIVVYRPWAPKRSR